MPALNDLMCWYFRQRQNRILKSKTDAIYLQENLLSELIQLGKNTAFGKEHGFTSIQNKKTFTENIPVRSYHEIYPWIDKMLKGEQNILWPEKINWFAKSSGTSSAKSKFLPVSKRSLNVCHFRGGRDVLASYCIANPDTKIFTGRGVIIGGSHKPVEMANGIHAGDVSAVMMENMPLMGRLLNSPKRSIALMDEWESKIQAMAEATAKLNVTMLFGVPSWAMVLIKKLFEICETNNIYDIWPNFELFVHGGVSFTPYRHRYSNIFTSNNMQYMETYNASEGFFALQDDLQSDDLLLMTDYGIYYEFEDTVSKKVYPLAEVETNREYSMIISTTSGLWRYRIGDTIQFTSIQPFKIKISGRDTHFINVFGEELVVANADKAIDEACRKTNSTVKEYTVSARLMNGEHIGYHEWLIEFEQKPQNTSDFKFILDQSLQNLNSDYQAKRYKNMVLKAPEIHIAKNGLFYKWLENQGKLGGQHKVPRMSNKREFIDPLLKLNNQLTEIMP